MCQAAKWSSTKENEINAHRTSVDIQNALQSQWSRHRYLVGVLCAFVVLLFLALAAVQVTTGIDAGIFTRDPLATTGSVVYQGSVSNLGVLIWSAAGVVCFFGYTLFRPSFRRGHVPRFILTAGFVTTMFVLDDLYLLHERLFPRIGIPEKVVYIAYVVILAGLLHVFRSLIAETNFLFLVLALAGFTMSIGWDIVEPLYPQYHLYLLEDGAKFFGIVAWTTYFVMTVHQYLSPVRTERDASTSPGVDRPAPNAYSGSSSS